MKNLRKKISTIRPASDKTSPITLAWRIGFPKYESDEEFLRLVKFLKQHRGVVDEVALFETVTHQLYLPLPIIKQRAKLMRERVRVLKNEGIPSVGINVLTTIGHANEAWDYNVPLPFQPMVGHDGCLSKGCACPNTQEFRQYIRTKYQLVAGSAPDFVWVDDDIRMQSHGVAYGCFCETCLDLFNRISGRRFKTRESLVASLNAPKQAVLREEWVEQNIRTIESLLTDISQTIRSVNPTIATGLMTVGPICYQTYSGLALDRWLPALDAVKTRPGGGFYSDANRLGMVHKLLDAGRQRQMTTPKITDCQYELENFPYQTLLKSVSTVMNECTLAFALGLNGIAFNVLGMWEGELDEFRPILHRTQTLRPLWERLAAHTQGLSTAGLWPAWSEKLMASRSVQTGEDWFCVKTNCYDRRYDITLPNILAEIGLPLAVDRPAAGTVLVGRVAEAFDNDALKEMLSGGVLMDSTALEVLTERGLDHYTGVQLARQLDNGVRERFSNDPLNGRHAGEIRDARIEFWGNARGMGDELKAQAKGVRVLATMETYDSRPQGACMTAFENTLGGRVVVMGYAQWIYLHSVAKRAQLQNVADWITRETLPVRIVETVPLTPFVRMSPERDRGAVVLLNTGLDPIEQATVHLRVPKATVHLCTPEGVQRLPQQTIRGGCRISLGRIEPWATVVLLLGK